MPDPHFVGTLEVEPNPSDPSNNTVIVTSSNFAFYDDDGDVWKAEKGEITDGASIPNSLKLFIGHSFNSLFLPAAVLHDLACQQRTRPWQRCAEMFFEALITNGVSRPRAATMWSAVYVFGPHWPKPGG